MSASGEISVGSTLNKMFGEDIWNCCKKFNISADDQPDLSRVTSLSGMFQDSISMNAPLEKWDVSNVTDMSMMFEGASSFNQPLEKWDVSNVTKMDDIFMDAVAMKSMPSWLNEDDDK